MPKSLRRITNFGDLHFITFCCYRRRALLETAYSRNLAIRILDDLRTRYRFALIGYVLMPEHVHLLLSESGLIAPSKIVQIFKQRLSRFMRGKSRKSPQSLALRFSESTNGLSRFWQRRYYDFNVHTVAIMREKIYYMHGNPVRAKLVQHPGDWPWSSWCYYYRGEGVLAMDRWGARSVESNPTEKPTLCQIRKG